MLRRRFIALSCALAVAGLAAPAARAQADYPSRPIRLVVGFPPGGISDVLARAIAAEAGNVLGQSIVVENRPGAGTTIGSGVVADAAPDGYTLLFQDTTTHAINASLYKKLPFDTVNDFTPIALVSSTPLMLLVKADSPFASVADLVARAKEKPGSLTYGSSGNGTIIHLASEMLGRATGAQAVHVPYKGSAPLVQALMTGEIDYAYSSMPPAVAQVKAGTLRGLAVTTPQRVPVLPDVPTIAEAGVPAGEVVLYSGVLGPKGIPADVVAKLNQAFAKAVQSDKLKPVYENAGAKPLAVPPEALRKQLEEDVGRYAKVVAEVGARID